MSNFDFREPTTEQPFQKYQTKDELLLAQGLHLCYEKRWVAEWLFTDLTSSVFRPDYLIPPNVFDHGMFVALNAYIPNPEGDSTDTLNYSTFSCIPVAHLENITIGYTFTFSTATGDFCSKMIKDTPFDNPHAARFVYDHRPGGSLIHTSKGGNPKRIGICCGNMTDLCSLEHSFIVPLEEYTWQDLPNNPIAVISESRLRLGKEVSNDPLDMPCDPIYPISPEGDTEFEMQENANELFIESLDQIGISNSSSLQEFQDFMNVTNSPSSNNPEETDSLFNLNSQSTSSHQDDVPVNTCFNDSVQRSSLANQAVHNLDHTPWMVSSSGHSADGVSRSVMSGKSSTSSAMFDLSQISKCLQDVEKHLTDGFYHVTPQVEKGAEILPFQTNFSFQALALDFAARCVLRDTCRQVYYEVVLTIGVDEKFFTLDKRKKPVRIAPKPQSGKLQTISVIHHVRRGNKTCACGSSKCEHLAARFSRRAKRLEDRKVRNRESAARSNERRKATLIANREELENNKRKVEKLKAKEVRLTKENKALREILELRKAAEHST